MASRPLPVQRNPLMTDNIPEYTELVARRRLGQTQLTAKMVAAADIDPSSLGAFDYAHLRAPLPKGIESGIFKGSPSSYFLMRRSSDGYVSATGMYKATFPYSSVEEEETERDYIKSLATTSREETAGNVWISPEQALALADEYGVVPWIRALVDPADIIVSNSNGGDSSSPPKKIVPPPKFFHGVQQLDGPSSPSLPRSSRARRSASPSKSGASKRAVATPRKRSSKANSSKASSVEPPASISALVNGDAALTLAPKDVEERLVDEAIKQAAVALEPVEEEPKLKVHVDQNVKIDDEGHKTTETRVEVEVPVGGEPPSAEEAAQMIADAKEMVKAAAETVAHASPVASAKGKRKAEEITAGDEEEDKENGVVGEIEEPRAKKVKTEVELKKERVRNRALLGISATLAVGALVPYVMSFL